MISMDKFLAVCLVLVVAGCSGESKKSGKSTAKNGKSKPAAAKPAEKAPPPEPKKFTVPANAYPGIPEALAALLTTSESAGDGNDATRDERNKATAWLAMQKGPAIAPLTEKLNDEAVGLAGKIMICRTLGQIGPAAEAPLTAALQSEQQLVRINAAEQLAIVKPTTASIVKTLIGLLEHEDPRLRERAIKSLAHIGTPAKDSADNLLAILNDSKADEGLRAEAKAALKKVNPRRTFQD